MSVRGALADLLYPWPMRCVCCGVGELPAGGILCAACRAQLDSGAPARSTGKAFSVCVSARPYAGPGGVLVRALKYRGMAALAAEMGDAVFAALRVAGVAPPDRACFVPMHRSRRMRKLFNQSELLARAVCGNLGIRPEPLLRRVRRCRQQAKLNTYEARVRNVEGAFRATKSLDGARILLIDDVYTTGATAEACAKALRAAGAREVIVAVYARGGVDAR